jgi:hypothetical protein
MSSNDRLLLISAKDIRSAFADLHAELKVASDLFSDSTASEDAGLGAVIYALRAVLRFLETSPETIKIYNPLLYLYGDLRSVQEGARSSMMKPKLNAGRPQAGLLYHAVKAEALFIVRILIANGMAPLNARKAVAAVLNKKGIGPGGRSGKVTAGTIKRWEEKLDEDQMATKVLKAIGPETIKVMSNILESEDYRQGDLLLLSTDNLPAEAADVTRVLLDLLADIASLHGPRKKT